MQNPHVIFAVLIALGVVWTLGWAMIMARSGRSIAFEQLERSENRIRIGLLAGLAAIAIVLFILSLPRLPFAESRRAELGPPQVTITATAVQWGWIISRDRLTVGVPIEFDVTSRDVNHDFAIYDPGGRLLTQVQAMPGYTNRLVYRFRAPGTYTVRCLEYCGLGHHMMTARLTVARQE